MLIRICRSGRWRVRAQPRPVCRAHASDQGRHFRAERGPDRRG